MNLFKILKRLSIIMIVLCMYLVLSPLSVIHAEDEDPTDPYVDEPLDTGVKAKVTFVNAPSHQPDLYVSKSVTSDYDSPIPDITFTFQIKVDNEAYANKKYELLDSLSNAPILDEHSVPVTGTTSASGTFTLKKDQTARFEYVGANRSYEITEAGKYDNFECIKPASGVSTGTIGKDGSSVSFVNMYTPPATNNRYGSLNVVKQLSWPDGYNYTDTSDPEFSFRLTVSGSPLKNQAFDLYNSVTGVITPNYGKTDEYGVFTIKADTKAMFKELEYDADYLISELTDGSNFRLVSENDKEGTTSKGNTEVFTNTISSFIVTKTMSKASTDDSFTFTLYGAGKVAMSDASYWLYSTDGRRIDDITHTTDASGHFELKQNEAAIFINIPEGTVYSVAEEPKEGYKQISPESAAGFEERPVTKNGDEKLEFVNEKKEGSASLTVTKKIIYENGVDAPLLKKSFDFLITVKNRTTGEYEPLTSAIYTIGSDTTNYDTGSDGTFSLKQNETASFDRLLLDREYRVYECITDTSIPGYKLDTSDLELVYDSEKEYYYKGGLLEDGNSLSFVISNIYSSKKLSLEILKCDNSKDSNPLKDATFRLYLDEECTSPYDSIDYITDENGLINIPEIKDGTYYIKEESAPAGYKVLPSPVKITITRSLKGSDEGFIATIDYDSSVMGKAELTVSESFSDSPLLSLTIKDDDARIIVLPSTGGIGIYAYLLIGAAMITYGVMEKRKGTRS